MYMYDRILDSSKPTSKFMNLYIYSYTVIFDKDAVFWCVLQAWDFSADFGEKKRKKKKKKKKKIAALKQLKKKKKIPETQKVPTHTHPPARSIHSLAKLSSSFFKYFIAHPWFYHPHPNQRNYLEMLQTKKKIFWQMLSNFALLRLYLYRVLKHQNLKIKIWIKKCIKAQR